MALKGTTRIELTNVKTGEKEVIEKDNLVTNALSDLVTLDPFLQRKKDYNGPSYMNTSQSFPICPNLAGGILLYEDALDEDADKYYAASDNNLVGYSSNDVVTTDDPRRGSMNQSESGALEDGSGYRFVFDFATSQANGTISGVGLTSKWGGLEGYGSVQSYTYGAGTKRLQRGSDFPSPFSSYFYQNPFNAICMIDGDNNIGYAAMLTGDNVISVASFRLNLTTVGLVGDVACPGIIEETVVETETFGKYATATYAAFVNDGEGYIWGLQYVDNKEKVQSGDAVINWVKIDPTDWSHTEGTWTFALPLYRLGYQRNPEASDSYKYSDVIIHEGYLYVYSYDGYTIYKININNVTDVTPIQFEDKSLMNTSFSSYRRQMCTFNLIGNTIIFSGGYIIGDTAIKAAASTNSDYLPYGLANCAAPALQWKLFLFIHYKSTYGSGNSQLNVCLMSPYLATFNNLPTPVQKTADKTMKITYILREES